MKKVFFTLVFAFGIIGFIPAQDSVATMKKEATKLPQKVIDPRTYQDTSAQIRYVNTQQLVQRGFEILQYNNGKPNAAGYTPHYDPNLHGGNSTSGAYVRIPRTGKDIYGNRW